MSPYYDSNNDDTHEEFREIKSDTPLVLLEGMFLFRDAKLRELLDFGIYVEVDDDVRLSRMGNTY
jgi:uridine kinase